MPSTCAIGIGTSFGGSPNACSLGALSKQGDLVMDYNKSLESKNGSVVRDLQTGRCYDFDGTDDYVNIVHNQDFNLTGSNSMSWSFRFSAGTLSGTRAVFINGGSDSGNVNNYYCYFSSSQIRFYIGSGSGSANVIQTVSDGDHILITASPTELKIYIEGVLMQTSSIAFTPTQTNNPFRIGRLSAFYSPYKYWDVRIYESELTLEDAVALKNYEEISTPTLAWYKMDESEGTVAFDSSGNERHGKIVNATPETFHTTQNEYSFHNQEGYSKYLNLSKTTDHVDLGINPDELMSTGVFDMTLDFIWESRGFSAFGRLLWFITDTGFFRVQKSTNGESFQLWARKSAGEDIISPFGFVLPSEKDCKLRLLGDGANLEIYVDDILVTTRTMNSAHFHTPNWTESKIGSSTTTLPVTLINWSIETASTTQSIRFSGNANNVLLDTSGAGNNATISGTPSEILVPPLSTDKTKDVFRNDLDSKGTAKLKGIKKGSNAGTFNGVNNYINLGNIPDMDVLATDTLKVETYFEMTSAATRCFVGKIRNNSSFRGWDVSTTNGKIRFYIISTWSTDAIAVETVNTVNDGLIHNLVVEYDGSGDANGVTFTLDGEVIPTTIVQNSLTGSVSTTSVASIGSRNGVSTFMEGKLFGVKVTKNGIVVLDTPITEGSGSLVSDVSGNGNHGKIVNATLETFWGATQDAFHYNLDNGFSRRLSFEGSHYIEANNAFMPSDFTMAWEFSFKTLSTNPGNADRVIAWGSSSNNNQVLNISTGNAGNESKGRFFWRSNSGATQFLFNTVGDIFDGKYHEVKVTFDGVSTVEIFIDDMVTPDTTNTQTLSGSFTADRVTFGALVRSSDSNHFTGLVWDIGLNGVNFYKGTGNNNSDWEDQIGNANGSIIGNPNLIRVPARNITLDAIGSTLTNPPAPIHNGAETIIDFKNISVDGLVIPETVGLSSNLESFQSGDTLTNPEFLKTDSNGNPVRILVYEDALTEPELSKVAKCTT